MKYIVIKHDPEASFGEFFSFDSVHAAVTHITKTTPGVPLIVHGNKVTTDDLVKKLGEPGDSIAVSHEMDYWIIIATKYGYFGSKG